MDKKITLTKEQLHRLDQLKTYHKEMKKAGGKVDVKRWSILADKYIRNKEDRDRFIELLDIFAIDVDLLTTEELWWMDGMVEWIDTLDDNALDFDTYSYDW